MREVESIYESGEYFDGRYKLLRPLSTDGGTADVWLAVDMSTVGDGEEEELGTRVAVKIYRPKNLIDIEGENQFRSEFKIVFNCHHANIIKPTYFSIFREMPYLVLPYCPRGSSELLTGQFEKAEDLWKYIGHVSAGLAYLHGHTPQIVHQDIKPANVLIDDDGNYAITDFGISVERAASGSPDENQGTFAYMAPERFDETKPPMPESDIWAFGATLYELITGAPPFGEEGGSAQRKETPLPALDKKVPDKIRKLVHECLAYEPEKRPTAREIEDRVLKRRFRRSRLITAAVLAAVATAALVVGFSLRGGEPVNPDAQFESFSLKADSIFSAERNRLLDSDGKPSESTIPELEKSLTLFNNAVQSPVSDSARKDSVMRKIDVIKGLMQAVTEYEAAADLAEKARRTELDDVLEQQTELKIIQQNNINKLITEPL